MDQLAIGRISKGEHISSKLCEDRWLWALLRLAFFEKLPEPLDPLKALLPTVITVRPPQRSEICSDADEAVFEKDFPNCVGNSIFNRPKSLVISEHFSQDIF